jgi:citrate synthase
MADQESVTELTTDKAPIKARGLEGVIALESELSSIDGDKGQLIYRGYDIHDLADHASFEEVVYLLRHGELPTQSELDDFSSHLRSERALPAPILNLLRETPADAHPMAVLRTAVSALALYDEEADTMEEAANHRKADRILAQIPTIIAAFDRLRKDKEPVAPLDHGSMAHNFLYMLNGEKPGAAAEDTFDVCLVLHADHGLNASTFTSRVIGSTLSDMYSAVSGSVGALKGRLHGGANQEVMRMLLDIDEKGADPTSYIRDRLDADERVMGFGHRVYNTMDPRAAILRTMVKELSEEAVHHENPRDDDGGDGHRPQRGLLQRPHLLPAWARPRPLHHHLCVEPHGRLDRPPSGAVGRQPPDPTARPVCGGPRPDRGAHCGAVGCVRGPRQIFGSRNLCLSPFILIPAAGIVV